MGDLREGGGELTALGLFRLGALLGLLSALALAARTTTAGGLEVQRGASLVFGAGALDAGCADVSVSGTLDAGGGAVVGVRSMTVFPGGVLRGGAGRIRAAGNWTNTGTFSAGTGTVELVDGCGLASAAIRGTNTFASLSITSTNGKTYFFEAAATQTITGALRLSGAPGNRLFVRSTFDGAQAFVNVQGSQSVTSVDVKDNQAIGSPIFIGADSLLSGNTIGWQLGIPVPAFPALGLLGALLGGSILWRISRSPL